MKRENGFVRGCKMWQAMAGEWDDERSTAEIVQDIYDSRSEGRIISL
jgi:hypothetical protein